MGKKINVDGYGEVEVPEKLSDSELDAVTGGGTSFYIQKCLVCGRLRFTSSKVAYCHDQKMKNGGRFKNSI